MEGKIYLLVQDDFVRFFALYHCLSEPHGAILIGIWALEETAIAVYSVSCAVLGRFVKF